MAWPFSHSRRMNPGERRQTPRTVAGIAAATALLLAAFGRRCWQARWRAWRKRPARLPKETWGHGRRRRNDEIGDPAQAFDVIELPSGSRRTVHKEIDLAQRIRTSLLPGDVAIPALNVGALMASASEVGGTTMTSLPSRTARGSASGRRGSWTRRELIMLMMQSIVASLVA